MLLLINPKFTKNDYRIEKANLMVLVDNSTSMKDSEIAPTLQSLKERKELSDKFNIKYHSFGNSLNASDSVTFSENNTNIAKALKSLKTIYGASNNAVVLLTDGNQTLGEDYEFYAKNLQLPVYPVVIGDTTTYEDFRIDQVNVNKYAFLKNRFPIEAYVTYQGKGAVSTSVTVSVNGKSVYKQNISFNNASKTKTINTLLNADLVGVKNIKIAVGRLENERNTQNNTRSVAVEVIDEKAVAGGLKSELINPDVDALRQTDVEGLDLGPPHQVADTFEEIGQTDGRHKEDDRLLSHKVAEHETLHAIGQHDHHDHRQHDGEEGRHMPAEVMYFGAEDGVDQMAEGHLPLHDPDQRQCRKQRHHALGKIENTRSLVDQHKAQSDQRIKNARHQTVDNDFDAIKKIS